MAERPKFPIVPVKWSPGNKGGLAADSDPKDMSNGGLYVTGAETGGLNVRAVGKGLNVSMDYEPIYGNERVYTLEEVVVQNKLFRIYVDISSASLAAANFILVLSSITGNQFVYDDDTITIVDLPTALTDIETSIATYFAAYSPLTLTTQTGTNTGYIDIDFSAAPSFNYVLTATIVTNLMTLEVVVTQESVDPSMLGDWNMIGSNDRTGDCFQFWTTRTTLPGELEIFDITNPAGTEVVIETVLDHNLTDGQSVRISGVQGVSEANGEWIISVLTPTTFELLLCEFLGSPYIAGTGTVTYNVYGLGEIGVATEDNNGVISYTRLLRSNEFNFSTKKQIDARTKRKQDSKIATYFADNNNQYRVFYYKGAYIADGAIVGVDAQYAYGSINIDLQLFISNEGFGISFFTQIQTGGSVKSGNWRYAVSFLTTELVRSEWSQLTDTVSVFSTSTVNPTFVLGDEEDIPTPKQNTLAISNAIPGLYDFVEIAGVNYIGNSMTGYVIGRYVLDGSAVQYINHTGNENNITDLDLGELNTIIPGVRTGQNLELLDGRLVISNITPQQNIDLTEWVETFQYSLEREALDPVGALDTTYATLRTGEYQLPDNIYFKKSHMIYETYRYGFRFRLKGSGALTDVFYLGYDIKIDLPATLPPERIAGTFNSFDLTDGSAGAPTEVYAIYINWLNINLGYVIDGVPVYDLISEIIPCRAEVVPEVLASGASILGVSGDNLFSGIFGFTYGQFTPTVVTGLIGPFPYISGLSNTDPACGTGANPTYPAQTIGAPFEDPERDSVFFFSPDLSWGLTGITYRSGDEIISFGAGFRHSQYSFSPGGASYEINYAEYTGYSNITANPTASDINEANFLEAGTKTVTIDSKQYSTNYLLTLPPPVEYEIDQCMACSMAATLANTGPNTDYGFYNSIYYRPLDDKYGSPDTTVYTEFGAPYLVASSKSLNSGDLISYGDVFTQKTYLKFRNPGLRTSGLVVDVGYGGGVAYYSQNRNNIQLKRKPTPTYSASLIIPEYPLLSWLNIAPIQPGSAYILGRDAQYFYNSGYTPRNSVTSAPGYDSTKIYQVDWGNVIMWSNSEADGSNTDNNRVFSPLNIKFLDYTFGAITDAKNINGQLVTVQNSQVMRQYFNTTELISSEIGSELILGDGGVMRREGQVLTKFGSQHKWSVIVGKSDKGFDVLYFFDVRNRTVCRYGYNGNDAIDEINGMKSFFANNLQWIVGKDTPADDEGIHGVSNQRYRELMWTLRGRKSVDAWVREVESGNLATPFSVVYGDELIINGAFAAGSSLSVQDIDYCPGWDQVGVPPPQVWFWNPPAAANNIYVPHAFRTSAVGVNDYLTQVDPISFNTGSYYIVSVQVFTTIGGALGFQFQQPSATQFSISTAGTFYQIYQAQAGDDNIYINGPALTTQRLSNISIKEILSTPNWQGAPTWTIDNSGALADGSDGDTLIQTVPDYIVPGVNYIMTYQVEYGTVGTVTAYIGDFADVVNTPISASGTYTFAGFSTVPGVMSFVPSGGFDGKIINNLIIYSSNPKDYFIGDYVSVPGTTTFEQTDDIYVAVNDNENSYPAPDNPDWQLIPHTNPDYYTEYSIIFAEMKDVFQSYFTPKPKIYAKFLNKYLVPRSISNTGVVYVSDSGTPTLWFLSDDGSQSSDAFFDAIINAPMGRKRFLNVRVEADIAPYRMEVETASGQSFTPGGRFQERPAGEFDAPVMNDTTLNGQSDTDTSTMYGDWARFRFIIQATTYNKINSFVAKVRNLARQYFK